MRRWLALAIALPLLAVPAVRAHHSYGATYDLAKQVNAQVTGTDLKNKGTAVMNAVDAVVLHKRFTGKAYNMVHGITITGITRPVEKTADWTYYHSLDFAQRTNWEEFEDLLASWRNRRSRPPRVHPAGVAVQSGAGAPVRPGTGSARRPALTCPNATRAAALARARIALPNIAAVRPTVTDRNPMAGGYSVEPNTAMPVSEPPTAAERSG